MSKSIAPVVIATDSFATLVTRVNQLADAMSFEVVTANGAATGSTTTGNVAIIGTTSSNTLAVTTALRGGTVSTPGNLNVTSNVVFTTGTATVNSNFIANNSAFSVYSNSTTIGGNNFTINSSNTQFNGHTALGGVVFANNDFYIHNSNTYVDSYETTLAGSTVNISPTQLNITSATTTIESNTNIIGELAVSNTVTIDGGILFGTAGAYGRQTFTGNTDLGTSLTPLLVWTYPKTQFTLANFYTIVKDSVGANVQATQASILTNGNDAYMTVFAVLAAPNTANLGVFTVGTDSANVNLFYTPTGVHSSITLNVTLNS